MGGLGRPSLGRVEQAVERVFVIPAKAGIQWAGSEDKGRHEGFSDGFCGVQVGMVNFSFGTERASGEKGREI